MQMCCVSRYHSHSSVVCVILSQVSAGSQLALSPKEFGCLVVVVVVVAKLSSLSTSYPAAGEQPLAAG